MRELIRFVFVVVAVFLGCMAAMASDYIAKAQAVTVLVANTGFLGGGLGSGFLYDKDHVITCAHMVKTDEDELLVYTYPMGTVIRATVVFTDPRHDVALLHLAHSVPLKTKTVLEPIIADGEPITVVGNTLGSMNWIVSKGIISGRERFYLLTDAALSPGNSGGPWINEKGDIVAMTDWSIGPRDGQIGIRGGISAKTIKESLANFDKMRSLFAKLGL